MVAIISNIQADELRGKEYAPDSKFDPFQDRDDNWLISEEEMKYCVNPEFLWVKELQLIEYNPKQNNLTI